MRGECVEGPRGREPPASLLSGRLRSAGVERGKIEKDPRNISDEGFAVYNIIFSLVRN